MKGLIELAAQVIDVDALLAANAGGAGDEERRGSIARIHHAGGPREAGGSGPDLRRVVDRWNLPGIFDCFTGSFHGQAMHDQFIAIVADARSGGEAGGKTVRAAKPIAQRRESAAIKDHVAIEAIAHRFVNRRQIVPKSHGVLVGSPPIAERIVV